MELLNLQATNNIITSCFFFFFSLKVRLELLQNKGKLDKYILSNHVFMGIYSVLVINCNRNVWCLSGNWLDA